MLLYVHPTECSTKYDHGLTSLSEDAFQGPGRGGATAISRHDFGFSGWIRDLKVKFLDEMQ